MEHRTDFLVSVFVALFFVCIASCSDKSESVKLYCSRIDMATDSVKRATDITQLLNIAMNMDRELMSYSDNRTQLTDEDRQAIQCSLEAFTAAVGDYYLSMISKDNSAYVEIVKDMKLKAKEEKQKIEAILKNSKTLGEFVSESRAL